MDLYGCHFEYAGVSSRLYDLIIANVNTSRNTLISGGTQSVFVFNKKEKKRYHIDTSYTDSPLIFDMEVMSEKPFTQAELRKIEKWLFYQKDYQKLFIDMLDDCEGETYELIDGIEKRLYLNCRFVNPEKLEYNGGIVGFKFTAECDTYMAYQEPIEQCVEIDSSKLFELFIDTDDADYVYPKVTITTGNTGGNITIVNHTDSDSRLTSFVDLLPSTTFYMNGKTNYISGNYYEKFSDKNFIRLLDGVNNLSVVGDIKSIVFEWQNMRYL